MDFFAYQHEPKDTHPYSEPARHARVKILSPKLTDRGPRALDLHVSPSAHDHAQLENRQKPPRNDARFMRKGPPYRTESAGAQSTWSYTPKKPISKRNKSLLT